MFESVHRKSQDAERRRLHDLRKAGKLKGFVLAMLGGQDHRLPILPPDLVPRASAVGYPTDFQHMAGPNLGMLAGRGERLTRLLVEHYLRDGL